MVIYLFDIDGTLIKTGGAGGTALLEAFSETFQVPEPQEVPFSGRTDRGIAKNLFRLHEIPDSDDNWLRLRDAYLQRLPYYLPRCPGEVLPGVTQLLNELSPRDDVGVGLLTGNARDGASLKLEHYGLMHHFSFGAYGDDHPNRDLVADQALEACHQQVNGQCDPQRIWIVGDTPLDIQCARAIGAKVVAVATGWHDSQRLADAAPDLLLDDLQDTAVILDHTLNNGA